MNFPKDLMEKYTEDQILEIVEQVVNSLSYKWTFSYHDIDDLKQQGRMFALKALVTGKYDVERPLAPFLYSHVRNRFINFKRDNYQRYEMPCRGCVFYDKPNDRCMAFETKDMCDKWVSWKSRNEAKRNIASPIGIHIVDVENESNMFSPLDATSFAEKSELMAIIDDNLPICLREDYLRMVYGCTISVARQRIIKETIIEILIDKGYLEANNLDG